MFCLAGTGPPPPFPEGWSSLESGLVVFAESEYLQIETLPPPSDIRCIPGIFFFFCLRVGELRATVYG